MSTIAELTRLREGQATLWLPPELSRDSVREVIRWLQSTRRKIKRRAVQQARMRTDDIRREPTEGGNA